MGGDVMNVRDVISPFAFSCAQFIGYLVFAAAWMFILLAAVQAMLEMTEPRQLARARKTRRANVLLFSDPSMRRMSRG
jgi:hypothetical protein